VTTVFAVASPQTARMYVYETTPASAVLQFPATAGLRPGAGYFHVANRGANGVSLRTSAGVEFAALSAGRVAVIHLSPGLEWFAHDYALI
jgi:hypothetical protein